MTSFKEIIQNVTDSMLPAALSWAGRNTDLEKDEIVNILFLIADKLQKKFEDNQEKFNEITNFPGYFFTSFKHEVYKTVKKNNLETELTPDIENSLQYSIYKQIEYDILLEQVIKKMDRQTRFIYRYMLLHRKYKEIVPLFNQEFGTNIKENALRSKFSRAISKIAKELNMRNDLK